MAGTSRRRARQADLAAEFIDFMTQEAFAIQLVASGDISPLDLGERAFHGCPRGWPAKSSRPGKASSRTGRCCRISIFRRRTGPKSSIRPCSRSSRATSTPEQGLARIEQSRAKNSWTRCDDRAWPHSASPYLYVLPAFLFFVPFVLVPFAHTVGLSFYDWDGLTHGGIHRTRQLSRGLHRPAGAVGIRTCAGSHILLRRASRRCWHCRWP